MDDSRLDKVIFKHAVSALLRIAVFLIFSFFVFTQVFGVYVTESDDMFPGIKAGDVLIYNRMTPPSLRDAVVYGTPDGIKTGRVEASESGTIRAAENMELIINGRAQPVQKKSGLNYRTFIGEDASDLPVTLRKDEYYVLGDKRDTAKDSRIYGVIKRKSIKGKVFMILRRREI